jgi:protein CpxP
MLHTCGLRYTKAINFMIVRLYKSSSTARISETVPSLVFAMVADAVIGRKSEHDMTTSNLTRRWLAGAALAGAFVVGGITLPVLTASAQDAAMHMHGGGHGDMHAMMMRHLDKMLTAVDATPDQKSRIMAILGGAMSSMGGVHAKMQDSMKQAHALLTAPTIDRGALESLRASEFADLDASSKTLVSAIADAAEVLTPAQRAKLSTMMMEHAHPH